MSELRACLRGFHEQYPRQKVAEVYDYDSRHFLLMVPGEGEGRSYGAMYLVSRDGKTVEPYLPFHDKEKYLKAVQSGSIFRGDPNG